MTTSFNKKINEKPQINNYLYLSGHCLPLGLAETKKFDPKAKIFFEKWIYSQQKLDLNKIASLVWGFKILAIANKTNCLEAIKQDLLLNPSKKVGFITNLMGTRQVIEAIKNYGASKVNHLKNLSDLNFGNTMGKITWYFMSEIDNQDIYLLKLEAISPQDLYGKLDDLPGNDLRRGIMNLKLAKSLLNLTRKDLIWDPFAGTGRLAVAGLDSKNSFYLSDVDEKTENLVNQNLEVATNVWQNYYQNLLKKSQLNNTAKPQNQKLAKVVYQTKDARKEPWFEVDFSNLAIVSEGYLGQRYQAAPDIKEVNTQLTLIYRIYKEALQNYQKNQIPEIIICFPYYQKLPNALKKAIYNKTDITQKLLGGLDYKLADDLTYQELKEVYYDKINVPEFIIYTRPDAFVGHLLLHLKLN